MKYSIIMPYYSRPELRFALDSFVHYYAHRDDIEVILVEDSKNFKSEEKHNALLKIIEKYKDGVKITHILDDIESYCSSSKYNAGVRASTGSVIVLTNPETPHNFDILQHIDNIDMSNTYVVCACASVTLLVDRGTFFNSDLGFHMWYQHTIHRNALYHFCSIISKDNYYKIGGFDERYSKGLAFEDDNFVKRVQKHNLNIVPRDDLYTYHIEHSRDYSISSEEIERLKSVNLALWRHQIETGDF